jgi:predicted Zn finger-like uncharacterized protein
MIAFACPMCGATIKVADDLAGRKGRCKKCRHWLLVPTPEPVVPPPVATAQPKQSGTVSVLAFVAFLIALGAFGGHLFWAGNPPVAQPAQQAAAQQPAPADGEGGGWDAAGTGFFWMIYAVTMLTYHTFKAAIAYGGAPVGAAVLVILLVLGWARNG